MEFDATASRFHYLLTPTYRAPCPTATRSRPSCRRPASETVVAITIFPEFHAPRHPRELLARGNWHQFDAVEMFDKGEFLSRPPLLSVPQFLWEDELIF